MGEAPKTAGGIPKPKRFKRDLRHFVKDIHVCIYIVCGGAELVVLGGPPVVLGTKIGCQVSCTQGKHLTLYYVLCTMYSLAQDKFLKNKFFSLGSAGREPRVSHVAL